MKTTKKITKKPVKKIVKQNITHTVFLLDQTGSMYSIIKDTINGFNSFVNEQKTLKNKIKFSLTLFNSELIDKRYIDVDIKNVELLDEKNYIPNGMTPLYDAIGNTIKSIDSLKDVLFVILTDGEENFSREYTAEKIKSIIEDKEKNGWKFLYLGVDLKDYDKYSDRIAIRSSVSTSGVDTINTYKKMSQVVTAYSVAENKSNFDVKNEFNK